MTLIKFDVEEPVADSYKVQYGQRVASKAFYLAAMEAPKLAAEVRGLKRDVQDRDREIAVLRQTLERARSAAAMLLEACGQGDLLDDPVPKSPAGSARTAPIGDATGTISPLPGERMVDFVNRLSASKTQ